MAVLIGNITNKDLEMGVFIYLFIIFFGGEGGGVHLLEGS